MREIDSETIFRSVQPSDEFAYVLAQELGKLAENHPAPDTSIDYYFSRKEATGEISTISCTPREFAEAVANEEPIGCKVVNFYRTTATPMGDPAARLIIKALAKASEIVSKDTKPRFIT